MKQNRLEKKNKNAAWNSHKRPGGKANNNHKQPARNHAQGRDSITNRNDESVLGKIAVRRVEKAFVSGGLFVDLIGMDLIDRLRVDDCRVQQDDVKRRVTRSSPNRSLRDLEVPNGRRSGSPGRAEDILLVTVQIPEVRRGSIRREEEYRFL